MYFAGITAVVEECNFFVLNMGSPVLGCTIQRDSLLWDVFKQCKSF